MQAYYNHSLVYFGYLVTLVSIELFFMDNSYWKHYSKLKNCGINFLKLRFELGSASGFYNEKFVDHYEYFLIVLDTLEEVAIRTLIMETLKKFSYNIISGYEH